MPRHDVTFEIPERKLGRADVRFVVKSDDYVLGTLEVSKGSLVWFPKKATYGCKMGWQRFHEFMQEHARRIEVR